MAAMRAVDPRVSFAELFAVPIDIVLSEYDVLQPDAVYFREAAATSST